MVEQELHGERMSDELVAERTAEAAQLLGQDAFDQLAAEAGDTLPNADDTARESAKELTANDVIIQLRDEGVEGKDPAFLRKALDILQEELSSLKNDLAVAETNPHGSDDEAHLVGEIEDFEMYISSIQAELAK